MKVTLEIGPTTSQLTSYSAYVLADPGVKVSVTRPTWKAAAEPETLSATLLMPRGQLLPTTFKAGAFIRLTEITIFASETIFIGRLDSVNIRPSARRRGRYEIDLSAVSVASELYQNPLTKPIMPIQNYSATNAHVAEQAMNALNAALPHGWKIEARVSNIWTFINSLDNGSMYSILLKHSAALWEPDKTAIDAIESFCTQWGLVPEIEPDSKRIVVKPATNRLNHINLDASECDLDAQWSIRPDATVNALSLSTIDTGVDAVKPSPSDSPQTGTSTRNPVVYENTASASVIGKRARSARTLIDSAVLKGEEGPKLAAHLAARLGPLFTSTSPPELAPKSLTITSDKSNMSFIRTLQHVIDRGVRVTGIKPPAAPIAAIQSHIESVEATFRGEHEKPHRVGASVTVTFGLCETSITSRPAAPGRWDTLTGRWTDQTTPWEAIA